MFDEYKKGRALKPTGDLLHVKPDHQVRYGGLLQRVDDVDRGKVEAALAQCLVLAVGPDVTDIEPGDVVLLEQHAYSGVDRFDILKDGTAMYPREAAKAVVERT
jgi:hypothetical protein